MSPLALRDGTLVTREVCTRFGITEENAKTKDHDKMFDLLERQGIKPVSAPREGASGLHYIDISRGADGVRKVTLQCVEAESFTVSIPAMGMNFTITKENRQEGGK